MIPFYDLQAINAQYRFELEQAAHGVIHRGRYVHGLEVERFERELQQFIGVKHAIGVGNGLDALRLILRGYIELGLMTPGDEVIVPAHTFVATVLAITDAGLKPVFVEPELTTYNMDTWLIEKAITPRTRAIITVHLYGLPCWTNEFRLWAQKHNLKIIEDNAQAFGAHWRNQRTGSLGDAAACSFYPTKPLGALGDGGAVLTNDLELAGAVRSLANYGGTSKYVYACKGYNSRLDELQAAFLNVKLNHWRGERAKRAQAALYYKEHIYNSRLNLPMDDIGHAWHLFVVMTENRFGLQQHLQKQDIETLIHYPVPIHKQTAFKEYASLDLPLTAHLAATVLSLPLSSVMSVEQLNVVIKAVNTWKG